MLPTKQWMVGILVLHLLSGQLNAQNGPAFPKRPFKQVTVEAEYFLLPDKILDNTTGIEEWFFENMLNAGLYTNISKRWQIGLHYSHIWNRFNGKPVGQFFVAGLSGRYNYIINKIRLYGDVGINSSNYCTCYKDVRFNNELPFKKDDILYLSLGGGMSFRLYKSLWFKLGMTFNTWLNKDKSLYYYGFNYGNFGLQLDID
jgi:hypothetical protein